MASEANEAVPDTSDPLERSMLVRNHMEEDDKYEKAVRDMREEEIDSDVSEDEETAHMELDEIMDPRRAVVMDESEWSSVLSQHRPKGNTGGKGVLADYEEAKRITRRRNETKVLKQREAVKKAGYNMSNKAITKNSNDVGQRQADSDEEDEDDEDFFEKFRAMRMQQLSSATGLPQFGKLYSVGKFEFVDEVDKADPRTFVVIHIFEDYLLACQRMNRALQVMAERYKHVKFLRLKATEADQTLSHSALPAFLVYKAGKLTGTAAVNAVKNEFQNEQFTVEDVEWLLVSKYGVHLPGVDISEEEKRRKKQEEANNNSNALSNGGGNSILQRYE